nr:unnamed protein product [Callosobruchus analis]
MTGYPKEVAANKGSSCPRSTITSRKTTTKFTTKDYQESVHFVGQNQQESEERVNHLRATNVSIQASLYCIGRDIFSIEDCSKDYRVMKEKSAFVKELTTKLFQGHMEERLQNPRVPRVLRFTISRILGRREENLPGKQENFTPEKRKDHLGFVRYYNGGIIGIHFESSWYK